MNSKKLIDEINIDYDEINLLKNKINKSLNLLYASSRFKIDDICITLSKLATMYEKEDYTPIKFEYYSKRRRKNYNNYYVIKVSKKDKYKCLNDFDALTHEDGFIVGKLSNDEINNDMHDIEFGFLTDNINRKLNLPSYCKNLDDKFGVSYSFSAQSEFYERKYIKDFIKYLFELQVHYNGKQLTYDEMQLALNNFLELEKDKPKQKIKEKK